MSTPEPDHEHRHPKIDQIVEAAIEAEKATGKHEETDEEAKRSALIRLGRLIGGWIIVLVGIAAIPLPGPGWAIVVIGLSMLPYAWAERTVRLIRRRVPGVPEEGQLPVMAWVVMGLLLVGSIGGSLWWRQSHKSDDTRTATTEMKKAAMWDPGSGGTNLAKIYGTVLGSVSDRKMSYTTTDPASEPFAAFTKGTLDAALVPADQATLYSGKTDESAAREELLKKHHLKAFAPVDINGIAFWPILDTKEFPRDDEQIENALDGVSEQISNGAPIDGNPTKLAKSLMADLGLSDETTTTAASKK